MSVDEDGDSEFKFIECLGDGTVNVALHVGGGEWHDFIMDVDDIQSNIKKFGHHIELERALQSLSLVKTA